MSIPFTHLSMDKKNNNKQLKKILRIENIENVCVCESDEENVIQHTNDNNNDDYIVNDDNIINSNDDNNDNNNENESNKTISTTTSIKTKSLVWEHFNRITDSNEVIWAKCKYCL